MSLELTYSSGKVLCNGAGRAGTLWAGGEKGKLEVTHFSFLKSKRQTYISNLEAGKDVKGMKRHQKRQHIGFELWSPA